MGNLLAQGASWLHDMRRAHMSSLVIYCRGADQQEILSSRGSSKFEVQTAEGHILEVQSTDFVMSWADVVPPPVPGDRIIDGPEVFEVNPVGQEPCFRSSDEFNNAVRIHTKKVARE